MNKETYERFKQENLGARMAKAAVAERKKVGHADELETRPVPNRVARRRMGKDWQRIEGVSQ